MASKEKELEERLREVGDRLASPPTAVDELLALLDKTESLLLRVEQSPSQPISNAIRPTVTTLVARSFLEHSDLDVKVAVASCISEITRITAPEAPYDDNLMKEIFERFVETFERLDDLSSLSFPKRVSILETLAKVRSCVVMLDLECDALILKMFQHFFKTIRPDNARMVFSPMETIMVLILEESEDISTELISCLLESVKVDNKDILPIARELGEKVISSCAAKIKPYLSEQCKSMNLRGYSSIVASICHDAPDVLEQNELVASGDIMADDSKQSEQTISDELHKGSGRVEQEVDCAEEAIQEKIPEQGRSNDGSMVNDKSAVEPCSPKQKSERSRRGGKPRKTTAIGNKHSSGLEPVGEDPNSISLPVEKKIKGRPVGSSGSRKKERDSHSLANCIPAKDVEASKNPVLTDNGMTKISLSNELGSADTIQRKRGRPNSKLSSKEVGDSGENKDKSSTSQKGNEMNGKAISSKNDFKKESNGSIDSEQKPLLHDDQKEPNIAVKPEEPSDATSPLEDKTPKQSSKKALLSKASLGMSSQKQKSCGKQHDKLKPVKNRSSEPSLKEMMSSGKKAHKTQGNAEEKMKTSSKRAREAEESPETPNQHEALDGSLVGSRIKVWWPDDEQYYQGTVETYDPSSKRHKILYDDGDIEILFLKKERWILLDKDRKKRQAKDHSIPDASSEEPQGKRSKTRSSSVSKECNKDTESEPPKRKGRPPKCINLAEGIHNDSSKVSGKSVTKKDGTKSSLAQDIPSDLRKTVRKSTPKDFDTKISLAENSPSDPTEAIGKSATKKDVGAKSTPAVDCPSDRSKSIGKSGTKKEAATKSKTGSKSNDDAENTPKSSSKTKDDAGSKSRKEALKGKLNKDGSAVDRKLKISGPIREKEGKISETGS